MTYTAGLIGLSGIGTRHRDAYEHAKGIDLVAIADVDEELLTERGEQWGIDEANRYESHADLLAAEELDAVSIATPSFLHHDHVLDAIDSTADPDVIWCEKPIATSVTEADEMVAACEEAGVDIVIDHQQRFRSAYRELRRLLVDERLLGDVRSVHINSPEELLRNGTHTVDLAYYLLDDPAERVTGYLTDHSAGMGAEYDDSGGGGIVITEGGTYLNVDCTVPREMHAGTMLFVGTEGKLYLGKSDGECRYWDLEESDSGAYGTTHVETELPESLPPFTNPDSMYRGGAEHVVEILDGAAKNISPGEEAAHVLEIIAGLFISHYTGAAVQLPLDRPLRDVTIRSN